MLQHMRHHHVHRHRRRDIHFELPPCDVLHVGAVKHGLHPTVPRPLHKGTDRTVLVAGLVVQELPSFQSPGEKGKGKKTGSKKKRWNRHDIRTRNTRTPNPLSAFTRTDFSLHSFDLFLGQKATDNVGDGGAVTVEQVVALLVVAEGNLADDGGHEKHGTV